MSDSSAKQMLFFDIKGKVYDQHTKVVAKIYAPCIDLKTIDSIMPTSTIPNGESDFSKCQRTSLDLRAQVKFLSSLRQTQQRSQEWFDMRKTRLTASDLAGALGESKFDKPFDVLVRKVGHEPAFSGNEITEWGVKFEPVAGELYCKRKSVELLDFGLIPHPDIPFLGASPDGITPNGKMVEMKCPPRRKITGVVPRQYWIQMQLQLEVCDLDECDFLECKFEEINSIDTFRFEASRCRPDSIGVLLEVFDKIKSKRQYRYCPVGHSVEDALQWARITESEIHKFPDQFQFHRRVYWKLSTFSCVKVQRDRAWFRYALPQLASFWHKVCYYRTVPIDILYRDHCKQLPYDNPESDLDDTVHDEPFSVSFIAESSEDDVAIGKSRHADHASSKRCSKARTISFRDSDTETDDELVDVVDQMAKCSIGTSRNDVTSPFLNSDTED